MIRINLRMLGQQREHIMEKKQNEATYSQQAPPSNGKRKIKCTIKDAAYYEAQARKTWGSDPKGLVGVRVV